LVERYLEKEFHLSKRPPFLRQWNKSPGNFVRNLRSRESLLRRKARISIGGVMWRERRCPWNEPFVPPNSFGGNQAFQTG